MSTRRNFLKTSLLGGSAFGLGLAAGLLPFHSRSADRFVLQAYLPADAETLRLAVQAFAAGLPAARKLPQPQLQAEQRWQRSLLEGLEASGRELSGVSSSRLELHVEPVAFATASDLLLQNRGQVLDPASDFGAQLLGLRAQLREQPAALSLSAVYSDNPWSDLLHGGKRSLLIDRQGAVERLTLDGRERELTLAGPAGETRLRLDDRGVQVVEAGCRHRHCQKQGLISEPGERIVCAPNRLLLTIA